MPVAAQPVFAPFLLAQPARGLLRVVKTVLAPPVGLVHRTAGREEEVDAILGSLVVELALQFGRLETAPLDDGAADALHR